MVLSSFSTFKKQSDIATDKSIVLLYCLICLYLLQSRRLEVTGPAG